MKLEQQVCSLELAKKLKELGVKQESLWWWKPFLNAKSEEVKWIISNNTSSFGKPISAFTVAELGEMLVYTQTGCAYRLWVCSSQIMIYSQEFNHTEQADTEANARAKMMVWLIENGHIKKEGQR